jgi:replication initiation protein RepC
MISSHVLRNETTGQAPRCAHSTEFFEGLPDGVSHYELIQLVQNLEKKIGLSSAVVEHLRYLITHTREVDWRPGGAPIVYRSVQMTATDRGRSERQIHNLERALYNAGLIQWNDTENYKRYGRRNEKGQIEYAFGVDLTPLGKKYHHLVDLNERHMAYMAAFTDIKRKVSGLRRQILNKVKWAQEMAPDRAGDVDDLVERFSDLPRITANMTITTLSDIYNQVRGVRSEIEELIADRQKSMAEVTPLAASETKESSDASEQNFRHLQPTVSPQSIDIECNQDDDDDRKKVGENSSFGLEHITYDQVLDVASDEFVEHIKPSAASDPYADLVRAAIARCPELGIGRFAWLKSTAVMGEIAAAVAVIIIDRNRTHPLIPVVNPGGVLRGMADKAKAGDLHLHRSIYAILKRDGESE